MGQECILEICRQVRGLPWGTFHLSRFLNFSQGNGHHKRSDRKQAKGEPSQIRSGVSQPRVQLIANLS